MSNKERILQRLRSIEKKWQEKWASSAVFEAKPDPSKPKYFVTVPYPYTSGILHVGHARAFVVGDCVARWKTIMGYNVLFSVACHVSGTPIEGISNAVRQGDQKTIELHKEYLKRYYSEEEVEKIIKDFDKPEVIAKVYSDLAKKDLIGLGCRFDTRRYFTSASPEHQKMVIWQYHKLKELGCLRKGEYPILYCVNHKNAVGEDDIKSGDTIKPDIIEFYLIKFKMGDNKYIVGATLRPETYFGVINIWIKPEATYCEIEISTENGTEIWIVSKECAEKLEYQKRKLKILKEFKGEELIGQRAYDIEGREVPILPGEFVDPDTATGVVYSVPSHAPFDLVALEELKKDEETLEKYGLKDIVHGLEPIQVIGLEGYSSMPAKDVCEKLGVSSLKEKEKLEKATEIVYKEEFYKGKLVIGPLKGISVQEAKVKVYEWLRAHGVADKMYEVTALEKPVRCRCGAKIVVAILDDQWFLDYSKPEWKKLAFECLSQMEIIPEIYRKAFEDVFEWLKYRPCVRLRGLGTRFPFDEKWIIESLSDSTIYMILYTIIHKIKEHNINPGQLTTEFWDYVVYGKDLDKASEATGIAKEVLEELRNEFEYWYPIDLRATAIMHISNHLSFFIFHHAILFDRQYWPKRLILFEPVISYGKKMSKSLGNVFPIKDVREELYSADVLRLYAVASADYETSVDWRLEDADRFVKIFEKVFTYTDEVKDSESLSKDYEDLSFPSKWILSELYKTYEKVYKLYERYKLRDVATELFYIFLDKLDSYKGLMLNIGLEQEYRSVVKYVLGVWSHLVLPMVPHTAEEINELLGNEPFLSIKRLEPLPTSYNRPDIVYMGNRFFETISDIKEIMKITKKERINKITIVLASDVKYELLKDLSQKDVNVKEIFEKYSDKIDRKILSELVKRIKKLKLSPIDKEIEYQCFKEMKKYLEKIFDTTVEIIEDEALDNEKVKKALPTYPAIFVE